MLSDASDAESTRWHEEEEEEEEEEALDNGAPVIVLLRDDEIPQGPVALGSPDRMRLTARELAVALEIRSAVESIPEIDDLSDMDYAQLGVVCSLGRNHNPLENGLYRAMGMQVFRHRYCVTNTLGEAVRAMRWMVETFPDMFLLWELGVRENGIVVGNYRGMEFFDLLDTPDKINRFMVAMYYFQYALSPDLFTIRDGPTCAWSCHRFGFSWSFRTVLMRVGSDLVAFNPVLPRNKCYRTNLFYDVCITMFKKLVAKEFGDRIEVGLTPSSRLDALFRRCAENPPTPEQAVERVLPNITKCLERRLRNERNFVLPRDRDSVS